MKLLDYLRSPFKELKETSNITLCAMLIALCVITSFLSFYVTNAIKVSFTFIFIALIGMKFGPVIAGSAAFLTDVIQYIVKPVGPFQPLIALGSAITGIIYGIYLYKSKTSLLRIILSCATVTTVVGCLLNTYALSILYGTPFTAYFITRLPKNIIMLPIEIILLRLITNAVFVIEKRVRK